MENIENIEIQELTTTQTKTINGGVFFKSLLGTFKFIRHELEYADEHGAFDNTILEGVFSAP